MTAKDSPLAKRHAANGARFVERDGRRLAADFGSPEAEYRAVRSRAGLLDLCHRSLMRFTGADRVEYLNGMVSNDLKTLRPGSGVYAAVLNVQGKILADVRIFCAEDSFLMDLEEFLKDRGLEHLNRHLVADEVEIEDLTERCGMISVQGPMSRGILGELFQRELPEQPLDHARFDFEGHEITIVNATHTGEAGYDVIVPLEQMETVAARLERTFTSHEPRARATTGSGWVGTEALELLRVEAGIPRYGIDMDEENLLLETGLESHVSFQKGCYLGQEVAERIRSRGHVNKKLAGLVFEGSAPVERGARLYAGEKEIGRVTSSVISPHLNAPIALGYVHRDFLNPGTRVARRQGEKSLEGKVLALPFYRPSTGA